MNTALLTIGRMADMLVVGVFAAWLLISLLVLLPRCKPYIRMWDLFALVPEWKFFAPNPARGDFHLLYRDQLADGSLTPWTEIALVAPRALEHCVWNPERRASKALFDAVTELAQEIKARPKLLVSTVPYLTLLTYISRLERFAAPEFTQFLVLYTAGEGGDDPEPRMVFSSQRHSL